MKIRLPTSLFGKNVHTTRNMIESLPAESAANMSAQNQDIGDASQDDTLLSTYQENILPSNVAAPYEDYIDDGSMTTCTHMYEDIRTRQVQIDFQRGHADTKNCTDSDSDIDLKLPLELLGSSCINSALGRFEATCEIDPELPNSYPQRSETENADKEGSTSANVDDSGVRSEADSADNEGSTNISVHDFGSRRESNNADVRKGFESTNAHDSDAKTVIRFAKITQKKYLVWPIRYWTLAAEYDGQQVAYVESGILGSNGKMYERFKEQIESYVDNKGNMKPLRMRHCDRVQLETDLVLHLDWGVLG